MRVTGGTFVLLELEPGETCVETPLRKLDSKTLFTSDLILSQKVDSRGHEQLNILKFRFGKRGKVVRRR